jgi:hypothetical protein
MDKMQTQKSQEVEKILMAVLRIRVLWQPRVNCLYFIALSTPILAVAALEPGKGIRIIKQ